MYFLCMFQHTLFQEHMCTYVPTSIQWLGPATLGPLTLVQELQFSKCRTTSRDTFEMA
jgi:hypothetical protein